MLIKPTCGRFHLHRLSLPFTNPHRRADFEPTAIAYLPSSETYSTTAGSGAKWCCAIMVKREGQTLANQLMTVLEGHIAADQWAALTDGFAQIDAQRPAELLASYLVQSTADPTLWRTVGIWSSQQAFDAFRASVQAPPPLVLFRSLGAAPTLALYEIKS